MGSEAGHRPPLHPEFISSPPATLQREQSLPKQISFQQVQEITIAELQKSKRHIPQQRGIFKHIGIGAHVTGMGSENSIKTDDFLKNFPNETLRRLPSQEAHTGRAFDDARSKAITAAANELQFRRRHPIKARKIEKGMWKATPVIGPDTINKVVMVKPDGTVGLENLGKPERVENGRETDAIQKRFATLAQQAKDQGWQFATYINENVTYIRNARRKKNSADAYSIRQVAVLLDPDKLAYIATPDGFAQYKQIAESEGLPLHKVAGGFKVEALAQMGAVKYITEKPEEVLTMQFDPADQERQMKKAQLLATGKMDIKLYKQYLATLPPTLGERFRRINSRLQQVLVD